MKSTKIVFLIFALISIYAQGQELTQTIRGTVTEEVSEFPLPGVNVYLLGTDPIIGASTNFDGTFNIKNVPVGRYDVKFTFIGYEPQTISNVLVHSGKSTSLNIQLEESAIHLEEILIVATKPKDMPQNEMAAVSARSSTRIASRSVISLSLSIIMPTESRFRSKR